MIFTRFVFKNGLDTMLYLKTVDYYTRLGF